MTRVSFLLLALFFIPIHVLAVGLGEIRVASSLNQPLNAEIELISVGAGEIDDIKVGLADSAAFEKAAVDRPHFLTRLRFQSVVDDRGRAVVRLTSEETIREPYLNFIVQMTSRTGVMYREYALLLDPPGYVVADGAQSADQNTLPYLGTAAVYGPVQPLETLWVIADRLRPSDSVSIEQMMMALQKSNPEAFIDNNINKLKLGVMLRLPAPEEIGATDPSTARRQFLTQTSRWRLGADRSPSSPVVTPADDTRQGVVDSPASRPASGSVRSGMENSGYLRLAETGREWLLSRESHPGEEVYPATTTDTLREQIADSEQDLVAVNEINRDLDELKLALEAKIETLQTALEEKDQAIAQLQQQLQDVAGSDNAGEARRGGAVVQSAGSVDIPGPVNVPDQNLPSDSDASGQWMDERWLISLATIVIGLSLLGFVVFRRRQREERGTVEDILIPAISDDEPAHTGGEIAEGDLLDDIFLSDQEHKPGKPAPKAPSQPEGYREPPADVAAVLTEADIYLAYRRYTQAENLIKDAMINAPEDAELMAKLLEVYAFRKDRKTYSAYLVEVSEYIRLHSAELWEQVLEMTSDLVPDHPLLTSEYPVEKPPHPAASGEFQGSLELGDVTVRDLMVTDEGQPAIDPSAAESGAAASEPDGRTEKPDQMFDFNLDDLEEHEYSEHEIPGLNIDLDIDLDDEKKDH